MELCCILCFFFFFKQKTAYEMRISGWSSDVCSSDLTTAYPAPSRMELKVAMRDASIAAEKAEDDTTKAYYTDHVEMLPEKETETYLTVFLARQDALEKAVEPVFAQFRGQREQQEAIVGWFKILSPAAAIQKAIK